MECAIAEKVRSYLYNGIKLPTGDTLKGSIIKWGPGPRALFRIEVSGKRVALLLVFCGIKPYYRPWIEVYSIEARPELDCCSAFACSSLENNLIYMPAHILNPGEPFYIDYTWDEESMLLLGRRVPPAASRLGYKMLRAGFTWIKHWYYPEGFMEGGEKLQGEKPLSLQHKVTHLRETLRELEYFISLWRNTDYDIMKKALYYAEASRRFIEEELSKVKN